MFIDEDISIPLSYKPIAEMDNQTLKKTKSLSFSTLNSTLKTKAGHLNVNERRRRDYWIKEGRKKESWGRRGTREVKKERDEEKRKRRKKKKGRKK